MGRCRHRKIARSNDHSAVGNVPGQRRRTAMTDHRDRILEIFAASSYVLLDFDGSICELYTERSRKDVAGELLARLSGVDGPVPPEVMAADDPHVIVRRTVEFAPGIGSSLDAELRRVELNL